MFEFGVGVVGGWRKRCAHSGPGDAAPPLGGGTGCVLLAAGVLWWEVPCGRPSQSGQASPRDCSLAHLFGALRCSVFKELVTYGWHDYLCRLRPAVRWTSWRPRWALRPTWSAARGWRCARCSQRPQRRTATPTCPGLRWSSVLGGCWRRLVYTTVGCPVEAESEGLGGAGEVGGRLGRALYCLPRCLLVAV